MYIFGSILINLWRIFEILFMLKACLNWHCEKWVGNCAPCKPTFATPLDNLAKNRKIVPYENSKPKFSIFIYQYQFISRFNGQNSTWFDIKTRRFNYLKRVTLFFPIFGISSLFITWGNMSSVLGVFESGTSALFNYV